MIRTTIAALMLAGAAATAAAQTPSADLSVIVTQGEASVKRAPDQAWVLISAEARAPKSGDAQKKALKAGIDLLLPKIGQTISAPHWTVVEIESVKTGGWNE